MKAEELSNTLPTTEDFSSLGRCLVVGGGGYLGRNIVAQLRHYGVPTVVFGRHSYKDLQLQGIECFCGDMTIPADISSACNGIDTVFQTASNCDIWGSWDRLYSCNVRGTSEVISACRHCGVKRLVYTSSPSVVMGLHNIEDGDESLPYQNSYFSNYPATKAIAEKQVLTSDSENLRVCALRPHLIWSKEDPHILPRLLQMASRGGLRIVGNGKNKVTLTHVWNAAWAHLLAARELATSQSRNHGKVYFVGDSETVYLWKWINSMLECYGLPPVTKNVNLRLMRILALCNEYLHIMLPFLGRPKFTRFVLDSLGRSHSFSCAAARRDFNYVPLLSPKAALETLR